MSARTITRTDSGAELEHEPFCLPRPDEKKLRIESFKVTRYGPDGAALLAQPTVTRCVECGAQVVEEPPE